MKSLLGYLVEFEVLREDQLREILETAAASQEGPRAGPDNRMAAEHIRALLAI